MAKSVANRPWSAGQLTDFFLAAEPFQSDCVNRGEVGVVPANRPPDLTMMGIDASGRVMRRGDAACEPIVQAALVAQHICHGADAGARLAFELQQIQLANAPLGPQVGRQAQVGNRVAIEVERQAFDAAGAEVPAGDDGAWRDEFQGCGHTGYSRWGVVFVLTWDRIRVMSRDWSEVRLSIRHSPLTAR